MASIFENITLIVISNGLILIIPGVNFCLIARYSLLMGLQQGLEAMLGVLIAIMVHVTLSIFGVTLILKTYPILFTVIKYSGALFLIYLGTKLILNKENINDSEIRVSSDINPFKAGFLADILNPFVSIFYISLFSNLLNKSSSNIELFSYYFTIFAITTLWFGAVAIFFAQPVMRKIFQSKKKHIEILSGIAMYYFSARVILG